MSTLNHPHHWLVHMSIPIRTLFHRSLDTKDNNLSSIYCIHINIFFCTGTCICHSLRCKIAIMGYFLTIGARQYSCRLMPNIHLQHQSILTQRILLDIIIIKVAAARSGPVVANNVVATPLQTFNMLP